MAKLSLDELNVLTKDSAKVIPIKRYFEEMELTDSQKQFRIFFATQVANIILLVLLMIGADIKLNNTPDIQYYKDFISSWIKYLIADMGVVISTETFEAIYQIVEDTIDNTIADRQTLSDSDRAVAIAEGVSNVVGNEADFLKALAQGKTKKTWVTKQDKWVRLTHRELNGKTIPINDLFVVGSGALMRFPCDTKYGFSKKEMINCRCSCEYS